MDPLADPWIGAWVATYSMSASEVSKVDSVTQLNVPPGDIKSYSYDKYKSNKRNRIFEIR